MRVTFLAALLATASPALGATLMQADFTGAINGGNANVKAPFNTNGFVQSMPFSGSFVFDADLVPGAGTFNVDLPTIDGATPIPAGDIFALSFGPLAFDYASGSQITPKVQYKNGQFNGFAYVAEFAFVNNWYQLRIEGGVLGVKLLTNVPAPGAPHGFVTGSNLINAHVDIGNVQLTNIRPYVVPGPAVPEPATWAMMIAGFGLLGAAARRQTRITYA